MALPTPLMVWMPVPAIAYEAAFVPENLKVTDVVKFPEAEGFT